MSKPRMPNGRFIRGSFGTQVFLNPWRFSLKEARVFLDWATRLVAYLESKEKQ